MANRQWPAIDSGRMIHKIAIQHQVASSDISGSTVTWADYLTAWAAIDAVRGMDVIKSGQNTTQLYSTITIWWQAGILPNMRVVANGRTHVIQSVENIEERNVVLKLNCVCLGNQ